MRRTRILLLSALLMAVAGPAQAGGGGLAHGCAGFSEGTEMAMADSCFEGVAHFVPAGETLTVRNDGKLPHTITAVDGSFDSGQILPGQSYEVVLDEPGAVRVYCTLHGTAEGDGMAGVLLAGELAAVQSPAGGSSPSREGPPVSGILSVAALTFAVAAMAIALRRPPRTVEPASG